MTALTGLGMLLAYPTITISAQENMTNTDQNMTNTDQNMTALGSGTISSALRGALNTKSYITTSLCMANEFSIKFFYSPNQKTA